MNKTRQWAMLTAVGCLALLAVGWLVVVKPQRSHASSLRSQAASVQTTNASLQTQIAQLKAEQKDTPAEEKLLAAINQKVPDNPALPLLIRQLSAAADGAGVTLVTLAPSSPTAVQAPTASTTLSQTGTASSTAATTGSSASTASPLDAIPVSISIQGSYFNIAQFFSAVESMQRAMLVTGFSIAPDGSASSSGSSSGGSSATKAATSGPPPVAPGTLNATLNATVFEAPAAAAAPTTATTGH